MADKPADKGRDFAPGRMEGGGKANAPGQNREDREKPDKPGQQKPRTITHPTLGTRTMTRAAVKAQKDALIAEGWTGQGLDVDDDDVEEVPPAVPPAG